MKRDKPIPIFGRLEKFFRFLAFVCLMYVFVVTYNLGMLIESFIILFAAAIYLIFSRLENE